jgi:hypothetical protein
LVIEERLLQFPDALHHAGVLHLEEFVQRVGVDQRIK